MWGRDEKVVVISIFNGFSGFACPLRRAG